MCQDSEGINNMGPSSSPSLGGFCCPPQHVWCWSKGNPRCCRGPCCGRSRRWRLASLMTPRQRSRLRLAPAPAEERVLILMGDTCTYKLHSFLLFSSPFSSLFLLCSPLYSFPLPSTELNFFSSPFLSFSLQSSSKEEHTQTLHSFPLISSHFPLTSPLLLFSPLYSFPLLSFSLHYLSRTKHVSWPYSQFIHYLFYLQSPSTHSSPIHSHSPNSF